MKYLKTYKLFESDFNFNFGDCEIYAIALHKLYGHPLYVVNGYYKEPDWDEEMGWTAYFDEPCHVVVKLPNGKYLDAQGEITEDELKKACLFANEVEYIKIEPISEEEAKYLYTSEDKEDEIKEVINMIKSNESYKEDNLEPKLLLNDVLDIQDCFIEIEEESNLIVNKSFYNIQSEEWIPIDDFNDENKVKYSIDFYITTSGDRFSYNTMSDDEKGDVISAIKRSVQYLEENPLFDKEIDFNIQYREMKRNYNTPSSDREIKYENIEMFLNKDIYSISFTVFTL